MTHTLMLMHSAFDNVLAQAIDIPAVKPPGGDSLLQKLGWVRWVVTPAAVLALFIAGAKFGYEKWSHGQVESPKMVAGVIIGLIIVAAAPQIVYASS